MKEITYTHEQLEIALLKQKNEDIYKTFDHMHRTFDHIYKAIDEIKSNQRWLLGLMGSGFLGLLGLMAQGFKWII